MPSIHITSLRERGTLASWVGRHAISHNGLSVVVGRNHDPNFPNELYLLIQMPPAATTYKVVLAWKDREISQRDRWRDDRGSWDD